MDSLKGEVRRAIFTVRHFLGRTPAVDVQEAERAFYASYLKDGMIVLDVGAYVGELTRLFSGLVGEKGRVHAFEPSSTNFRRLREACKAAPYRNIILNQVAMAEIEGSSDLYIYDENLSWSSLARRPLEKYGIHINGVRRERVSTMTVDAYCRKTGISQIDLLKIDVEGAEYQVLLGARRMLAENRIRCCTFEFGQTTFDMDNDPREIEDYLSQFRYTIRNVVKGDPVFPGGSSPAKACFSMHVAMPEV